MSNKYNGYILVGYREDGKEIRKYCSASTLKGLERKKIELRKKYFTGELSINNAVVRDFAKEWLKTKELREPKTFKMYSDTLRLHVLPVIGHMLVANVRQQHIQEIITKLNDKPRTAQIALTTLTQLFKKAKVNKLCNSSPVEEIEMPTYKPQPKRRLTDLELMSFYRAELSLRDRLLFTIMLRAGLADNELCGLRKRYVDMHRRKLLIRGVVDLEHKEYKPYPKVRSRFREIPIPDDLYQLLEKYLPSVTDFLFFTRDNALMSRTAFRRSWERVYRAWNKAAGGINTYDAASEKWTIDVSSVGLDVTPYLLRHEYASTLCENGYSIVEAQALMGHSSSRMLLEVYAHVDQSKITAEKLNGGFTEVGQKFTLVKSSL